MRAAIWAMFLGGALSSVAVGCGDDSDGAGDKEHFISQLCAEYAGCCEAAGRPSDGAQCRAFYGAFVSAASYDQAAADACLEELRAEPDICDNGSASTPSCSRVFSSARGTKKPGEPCEDDDDCAAAEAGRVECVSSFSAGASVQQCQVRLPGQAGSSPCVGTVDGNITYYSGTDDTIPPTGYLCDRADGISCNGQTGACESLAAVGEPCSGSQCVPSAYCDFMEGVCKQQLELGAACTDDEECMEDAYCATSGKTCAARAATGAACTTNAECASDRCTNQKCAVEENLSLTFLCGTN
jgi:hypothetical protein